PCPSCEADTCPRWVCRANFRSRSAGGERDAERSESRCRLLMVMTRCSANCASSDPRDFEPCRHPPHCVSHLTPFLLPVRTWHSCRRTDFCSARKRTPMDPFAVPADLLTQPLLL